MLRLCLPDVSGRGAGLGNEMIPWARAHLAAQVLGARCLRPAFGLNARGYARHFGSSRLDWLHRLALKRSLPVVAFTEQDYLAHGGGDVVVALQGFAQARGLFERQAFVLTTQGMWGGFAHIEAAREYMAAQLMHTRFAARNLLRLRERLCADKLTVGIHVRLGDFGPARAPDDYRGQMNVALPLEWYRRVAGSIQAQLGDAVQFLVVSDAPAAALRPLTQGLPCILTADLPDSDCSDLLALAQADLLVCSISSFSLWAAFLSRAPYLWYGPQLQPHPEGFLSIWGHETGQQLDGSPTRRALAAAGEGRREGRLGGGSGRGSAGGRAWAVWQDGAVPAGAVQQALGGRSLPAWGDLARYGVIPAPASMQEGVHA